MLSTLHFEFNLRRYIMVKLIESGVAKAGPARYCPPRHPHAFEIQFLELNDIL